MCAAVSTISPAILGWFFPGAAWFYRELIPVVPRVPSTLVSAAVNDATLDARARMGVWQLTNCAFVLFFDSQNKLLTIFFIAI